MRTGLWQVAAGVLALTLLIAPGPGRAEGALHLYNWQGYTSPELIARFEAAQGVEVTVTEFASPEEALETVRAGGHGQDLMVVRGADVAALARAGLLLPISANRLANFGNIAEPLRRPPWDRSRRYAVPWAWGGLGLVVDGAVHAGGIDSAALVFEPPEDLAGRIHVAPDRRAVIGLARRYLGLGPCAADDAAFEALRALLAGARPRWRSVGYGLAAALATGEVSAALYWNEPARRARAARPSLRFAFPREGIAAWADELVMLRGAENRENARLFLDFVMAPENAALLTAHSGQASAIAGAAAALPAGMQGAPELALPAGDAAEPFFPADCRPEVTAREDALWDAIRDEVVAE